MIANSFPLLVQQHAIHRYRKNSIAEKGVKLDALRNGNGLSREIQFCGIEGSCHQHVVGKVNHLSLGIGYWRTAVEQDSACFAVKRSQIEDIIFTDRTKERRHKQEMISIGQEIRPPVRPFVPACIQSRPTLRHSACSRDALDL